jgi:ketosteroid isomerase-like protein
MMEETDFDRDKISAALLELAETVKTAYKNNDVEMYASAFDDDAIVSVPGVPPVRGLEELKKAFKARPQLPAGATFEVVPTELEIINGEWAYAFGTDTLTVPGDGEPVTQTMTFMVLIRRTPAGWKTFREVLSADQPQHA